MSEQPPQWPGDQPDPSDQQQPGWGEQPPPPPGAPYGAPATGDYSVGNAVSYGWRKFTQNVGPFLLLGLIYAGSTIVVNLVGRAAAGDDAFSAIGLVFNLLGFVVATFLGAAGARGALDVVEGNPVSLWAMFQRWDMTQVLIAAVLVSILTFLGLLALIIGAVVVAFLTYYTTFFVVGGGQSATDAIKASFNFTKSHVGELLPLALLNIVILIAGACLCGVGLFVAYPVTVIAAAYAFRSLHGQPIAP